ncbi:fumarylacetoacetate hydrolase family protein [Hydrocarboniclastica marina]|uniref:Fumarylacetoacetate hydrolase family protein n=1 Tax=Hydrocarboniclastica marina TaxID=2259620 RepID=A0A4V1D8X0_9ALTE|nr:fumarylacetoacetate hydrolase family protein [Hydrocarboniclastica marina]QCF26660.1 fumarylacetoacetate hydrolase family protein [Hydrocarboniclastica marina]
MRVFTPRFTDCTAAPFELGKIVCVGRNYAEHARELGNPVPSEPLIFMKPATAACEMEGPLILPTDLGKVHYETELALLVGRPLRHAEPDEVWPAIVGVGLALDLTLRDLQAQLKEKGHPWEVAKGFDGACPLSHFLKSNIWPEGRRWRFSLTVDGELQQHGDTGDMLTPVPELVAYMSRFFTLNPGDVILTGTPAGVGSLSPGQSLELTLEEHLTVTTTVAG